MQPPKIKIRSFPAAGGRKEVCKKCWFKIYHKCFQHLYLPHENPFSSIMNYKLKKPYFALYLPCTKDFV
jgi:hypothetical protein